MTFEDVASTGGCRRCATRTVGWLSYTAHSVLCVLYVGVGVGYIANLVISHHLWGMRSPALMFALAAVHWVFVNRRQNV